ncbi:abscisic acid receptor PYL11-like [Cornus florida]|uniref:abscisic acid receptor PYL11-like n=1 Tax=Cornus florida TaxID=4283 RepID=UPI00289FC13F|nr:abscisic acid receptor PYL11-like [Cornus florida]
MNMFKSDQPQILGYESSQHYQAHTNNTLATVLSHFHAHVPSPGQSTSTLVQTIDAPLPRVWSMVRCFSNPQAYKMWIRRCTMHAGDGGIGSVRQIELMSGLPATTSTDRLDFLDDDMHVMTFRIIGGDHRLVNYRSTTSVHQEEGGKTVVVESYTVDVPAGNTKEETCCFVNTYIGFNLRSLTRCTAGN